MKKDKEKVKSIKETLISGLKRRKVESLLVVKKMKVRKIDKNDWNCVCQKLDFTSEPTSSNSK